MNEMDPEDFALSDEEEGFMITVSDHFLALRGAPLNISPKDFEILEWWQREGIPPALILEVMNEVFAGIDRRGKSRRVNLSYLTPAVEEKWQALVEILTPGLREGQTIHDLL